MLMAPQIPSLIDLDQVDLDPIDLDQAKNASAKIRLSRPPSFFTKQNQSL